MHSLNSCDLTSHPSVGGRRRRDRSRERAESVIMVMRQNNSPLPGRSSIVYSMTRMRVAWVASRCSPAAAAARSISRRRSRIFGLISRDR